MTNPYVSAQTVESEFDFAYELLTKHLSVNFIKPTLCLGDEEVYKFRNLSFIERFIIKMQPTMIYDNTLNRILISNGMLEKEKKYFRIFGFLHESTHAIISQTNPDLTTESDRKLANSKVKKENEKAYVYLVFDEGLADFVALYTSLRSNDSKLIEEANLYSKLMENEFKILIQSFFTISLAKIYHKKPEDWQGTLTEHLRRYPETIDHYKYSIGYSFASSIKPTPKNIIQFISNPPTTFKHLFYPDTYLKTLNKTIGYAYT